MRRRGRTDANQEDIVRILRLYPNISVEVTSMVGDGFPDIIVGYKNTNYLFEIKNPNQPASKRILTKAEQDFHSDFQGQIQTVETAVEILDAIGFGKRTK